MSSLKLTEGIRQAVLLAEGVTRALIASASGSSDKADDQYAAAIDSFRQLEDWPGSEDTEWLRQQARYNEAVVWRYKSAGVQRSVLMLTDLLGEKAPDTQDSKEAITHKSCSESPVSQPICLCARVARLSGLAKYTVDDWATFPNDRAQLIITDGDKVIPELERIWNDPKRPSHDQRIARYLHAAAVQAFGHIELMYTKTKLAKDRYGGDGRIIPGRLTEQGREVICSAIKWLEECDLSAAVCENYSDLAEAYLLRGDAGDYVRAQGYARHATLNPVQDERAFYLAAESALRQGTAESIAVAKQYAQAFHGTLTLDELKSIRRELELPEDNVVKASDAAKASAAASRS